MNKKISELPVHNANGEIIEMAVLDYTKIIHRVNLDEFDFTDGENAFEKVKESLEKYGHVLVIPYKPL